LKLSPIRDLKLSRQEKLDYLSKSIILGKKAQYSINKGLWNKCWRKETLTSDHHFLMMLTLHSYKRGGRESDFNL
jgi:argininosuccinate synthase